MSRAEWLTSVEFADAVGIARRVASKALRRAANGETWRGHLLEVRQVRARGGKSGLAYEVSLTSVQAALEDGSIDLPAPIESPLRLTVRHDQSALVSSRYRAIASALEHARGTVERAAALRAAESAHGVDQDTLRRWIRQYERYGMPGLARKRPANAGKARIVISQKFDPAYLGAGGDAAGLERLGVTFTRKLRGIWQSRAEAGGWAQVRRFAEWELGKLCKAEGLEIAPSALSLSRRHVERYAADRIVNTYRNNRKAFEDGKPRIRRDWTQLAPMARVVADVKHLDVVVTRPDGAPAWPKVIGFHDGGTGRVFLHPVLLPAGEGVRQEHVVEAFMAMVADPMWGFPQGLYLDNGSEFAVFERIRTAFDLVANESGRSIIYSKPYNASAKTVENAFKRLDQYLFSTLPGYVGGDRMNKKTQTVGRPPLPYPGSWEDFCATLRGLLIAFNARPVGGQWGGRSADDWVREKQGAGWRAVTVDPLVLDAAFCTREVRKLDRGTLRIGGERYYHPSLDGLPHGAAVEIALPWRCNALPLLRAPGGGWATAEPDYPYLPTDKHGARDAARRQQTNRRALAARTQAGEAYDPVLATLDMAASYQPPVAAGRADRLDAGGDLRALADGRSSTPYPREGGGRTDERARQDRETARLERAEARRLAGKGASNAA